MPNNQIEMPDHVIEAMTQATINGIPAITMIISKDVLKEVNEGRWGVIFTEAFLITMISEDAVNKAYGENNDV